MDRVITLSILTLGLALGSFGQTKRRVAVLNFEYGTVSSNVASIFGTNTDVGRGIADLIVEKLVTGGTYSVVERKAIDRILNEQAFSSSDRADPATAAKLGKLLGVEAIIIGSITQFGRDDKTSSVGGGLLRGMGGRYGVGGVGRKESKAVVALSARMVSTDTGEVLAVSHGKGESTRSGAALLGSGGSAVTAAGGAYDMTSKNFSQTILGEAVHQAVDQLSRQLEQTAPQIPIRTVRVDGLVADVSGKTLTLNVGARAGVKKGDRLVVSRPQREIRDPSTGRVIRRVEDRLGEVVITEVDELASVGTYTGAEGVQVGDTVKSVQ